MDKLFYVQLLNKSRPVLKLTPKEYDRVLFIEGNIFYILSDSTLKFVAIWLGNKDRVFKKVTPAYYGPTISLEEVFEINSKVEKIKN